MTSGNPEPYAAAVIARNVRLIRGPTGRPVFGTWCSQWCCVGPAITRHDPDGRSSARRASRPRCFIWKRRTAPSDTLAEELKQFVKAKIAPYKYPRWIVFVDELPKTATGKIQRFKLRELDGG